MAFFKNETKQTSLNGYISIKDEIKESFKGEIRDVPISFPKQLGAEHPFRFEDMEKIYKSVGIVTSAINKFTDSIVGDFAIKTKTKKANKLISDFVKNTNFATVLREWIRESLTKGNGFLEIDLLNRKIKVLNANNVYVKRDTKGNVIEYNQWSSDLKRFSRSSSKLITFKPMEIAHLAINKISGDPYGIGIIWQNERVIENLILNEEELHKLISRKAGAPIHVKVGRDGEMIDAAGVDTFKKNLQFMTNKTEWVTDSNVDMKVIDFGEIGKNITDTLNHDMLMFAYGLEIPIVLFGGGNIPEGLAKVQLEAFQRKIGAIQDEIESIIEEHIFKPILEQSGSLDEVEFSWNLPGEEEINNRLEKLTKLIETMNTSDPLRKMAELEIAKLLNLENASDYLSPPEKEQPRDNTGTQVDPKKDKKLFK